MKKLRIAAILIAAAALGSILTACGSKKKDMALTAYNIGASKSDVNWTADTAKAGGYESGLTGTTELDYGSLENFSMEKIITKVNLEVETQDFDNLIDTIKKDIAKLDGYEEKTEISGKRYYSSNTSRYGNIVARIPKERLNEFVEIVKENGNVINESSSSENVTLQYVDTESRKKSLEIEQERLFAILEKAESLEDIVTLESRLSSIRHDLQMYETELRTIDNQVEYSTVTISVYEVERMTPVEDKETMLVRIKNGFNKTIYDISEGLKNFVVWFVVNLPYIIIWAAVISAGALIIKKICKKYKNKKENVRAIGIGEKLSVKEPEDQSNKEEN